MYGSNNKNQRFKEQYWEMDLIWRWIKLGNEYFTQFQLGDFALDWELNECLRDEDFALEM